MKISRKIIVASGVAGVTVLLITLFQNFLSITPSSKEILCSYFSGSDSRNSYGMGNITSNILQAQNYDDEPSQDNYAVTNDSLVPAEAFRDSNNIHHFFLRYKPDLAGKRAESRFCKEVKKITSEINEVDNFTFVYKWKFRLRKGGPDVSATSAYKDGKFASLMQLFVWPASFDNSVGGMHGGALVLNAKGGLNFNFHMPKYKNDSHFLIGPTDYHAEQLGSGPLKDSTWEDCNVDENLSSDLPSCGTNNYYITKTLLKDFSTKHNKWLAVKVAIGYSQVSQGFLSIQIDELNDDGKSSPLIPPRYLYKGPTRFNSQKGNAELKIGLYKGTNGTSDNAWNPSISNRISLDANDIEVYRINGLTSSLSEI